MGGRSKRGGTLYRDVIDKPRLADARGDKKPERPFLGRGEGGKRFGVARFEVIEREAGLHDRRSALAEDGADWLARSDFVCAFGEHAMQSGGRCALARRQVEVPRREREPVR